MKRLLLIPLLLAGTLPARAAAVPDLRLAYGSEISGEIDPCG